MRILYVENHDIFARTVASQFLAEYEVVIVATVDTARDAVERETPFDAVLVDYDLDDDRGNEELREAGADANCPKVMCHRIGDVIANRVESQ